MDRMSIVAVCGIAVLCVVTGMTASVPHALAQQGSPPIQPAVGLHDVHGQRGVPAILVQRRVRRIRRRSPEWYHLKELEDYYDDLEDFYDDRDPYLADYYERIENYYEDVRKGRRPYLPPEAFSEYAPAVGPRFPPPESRGLLPDAIIRSTHNAHPHTNLESAYRDLRQQLARLNTGESWLRYLALPLDTDRTATPLESLLTAESKEQFTEAMRRFDSTAADREFRVIARLPAFGRTRSALRSFNRWLDRQPTLVEPAADAEEIPTPEPTEEGTPINGPLLTPDPR